jgi:hypothetical protein
LRIQQGRSGIVELGNDADGAGQELLARVRQQEAARASMKKADAERCLERIHLPGNRRDRDVARLGHARERTGLGDIDERLKVVQHGGLCFA